MSKSNWYYRNFFTLKELLGTNFIEIKDLTLKYFETLDNIKVSNNEIELANFINIIFYPLEKKPSPNIYSRYPKYNNDGTIKNPSEYNYELAQKLYQVVRKFWLQNKFFNATMSWDKITDLLSETKTTSINKQYEYKGNRDRTDMDKGTNDSGEYLAGETTNPVEYDTNHATSGNREKYEDSSTIKSTEDNSGKSNYDIKSNKIGLRLDYLKDIYDIIDRQSSGLTRCFYNYVNFIIIPNQNITFEQFPWPWTFTEGDNQ